MFNLQRSTTEERQGDTNNAFITHHSIIQQTELRTKHGAIHTQVPKLLGFGLRIAEVHMHKGFGAKWIHWISMILGSGTSQKLAILANTFHSKVGTMPFTLQMVNAVSIKFFNRTNILWVNIIWANHYNNSLASVKPVGSFCPGGDWRWKNYTSIPGALQLLALQDILTNLQYNYSSFLDATLLGDSHGGWKTTKHVVLRVYMYRDPYVPWILIQHLGHIENNARQFGNTDS
ncbi:hypothetical protein ACJX0J_040802 [Zea mays]